MPFLSQCVGRHLERRSLLIRDAETAYLDWDGEQASPLDDLTGHSITYRIALGPHERQKAFTLQTLPPVEPDDDGPGEVAEAGGFSLHAGIAARADQRANATTTHVRYSLKTPWRDGTTHVLFEPLDFIARLATLIPRPGVNLTRYHGVFAPNSRFRT